MKILKIKKVNNKKLFKEKLKSSLSKNSQKDLKNLIDKYYKIKTLAEHLEGQRQALRTLIIYLMEEKNIKSLDTGKYLCELYTMEQTRLDIEEMKRTLPKEQLELFEIKLQTKALRVIPKNEEEAVKDVINKYPKIFKRG